MQLSNLMISGVFVDFAGLMFVEFVFACCKVICPAIFATLFLGILLRFLK